MVSGLEPRKRHRRKGRKKKRKERKVVREGDPKGEQRARSWMNFLLKIRQSQVSSFRQKEVSLRLAKERSTNQELRQRLANPTIRLEEVSQKKKGTDPGQRTGGAVKWNEIT